jgi:hypothetical protein
MVANRANFIRTRAHIKSINLLYGAFPALHLPHDGSHPATCNQVYSIWRDNVPAGAENSVQLDKFGSFLIDP